MLIDRDILQEGHGPAWTLNLSGSGSITSPLVVLATGASPKSLPTPQNIQPLELDDILDQSKLDNLSLDPATSRVAVVGSSHSAVLALKFLWVHARLQICVYGFWER